ncbi:hypothetical protein GCM10008967_03470 [Bacillus carboniphilus]|uniref:Uncharacterized protein n=1 Tax=Bacillus carboniphilus TaxID=86663 RepID=A0ABP3FH12_9BACI
MKNYILFLAHAITGGLIFLIILAMFKNQDGTTDYIAVIGTFLVLQFSYLSILLWRVFDKLTHNKKSTASKG